MKLTNIIILISIIVPANLYAEVFLSNAVGLHVNKVESWSFKESKNKLLITHKSGEANCIFSKQSVPGLEVLSKSDLKNTLIKQIYNPKPFVSLLKKQYGFRYVQVINTSSGDIGGWHYIEHFIDVDSRKKIINDNRKDLDTILVNKKIRIRFLYTNGGVFRFTCTSGYGDFDTANRAFEIFLNSVKFN